MVKSLLLPAPPSRRRGVIVAVLASAAAVGLARIFGSHDLGTATSLCLLAVVFSAAVAGRFAGFLASLLTFFGLNFFFTRPLHTLAVRDGSDLIGLFAFVLSAAIVGTLLARALDERARAERRANEAQLLSETTSRFISGKPIERILKELAAALLPLFGLSCCEFRTASGLEVASSSEADKLGPSVTVALATQAASLGTLTAVRSQTAQLFTSSEAKLLETLARQTALAIERTALDEEVRSVHLEAEASRLRAALFSSVTHDLRTPLSSIKASATGFLAKGVSYTDEQRNEMARTVIEETDHLNQIIGNLLDLARMRAGALVPAKEPVFVEDVIAVALRRLRRILDGFSTKTNIRPQLPAVDADPVQLEQVLSNILENAVRYSTKGSEIQISAVRRQETVQTRVTDQGPGIAPEDRQRVFEEFYSRDLGSGRGGSGLGLAIAQAVVVGHGGRIWVEGAPGGGTAVAFELPMAKEALGNAIEKPPSERVAG